MFRATEARPFVCFGFLGCGGLVWFRLGWFGLGWFCWCVVNQLFLMKLSSNPEGQVSFKFCFVDDVLVII